MLKTFILMTVCLFAAIAVNAQNEMPKGKPEATPAAGKKANARPADEAKKEPFDNIDAKVMSGKCVRFETEKGSIELEMFAEVAPETVRNFLNLTAIGAFNETTFSRVVPGFVIQGGNLYSNEKLSDAMKWRAQRTIADEPNAVKHERGILSMARSDEPNSATTSFFILLREASTLDGKFAAFGRVTKGMETVEEINKMKVENEKPENPVRIKKATVFPCEVVKSEADTKAGNPEVKNN